MTLARAEVPFVPADWTKNRSTRWGRGRGRRQAAHAYTPREHRFARDLLAFHLRRSMTHADRALLQAEPRKLWVDILVTKRDHRADAANVIDAVLDAVQEATGLNDRWYAVRCDWQIGDRPRIEVRLSRDAP